MRVRAVAGRGLVSGSLLLACSVPRPPPAAGPNVQPPVAMESARNAIGGRVGVLLHLDRMRSLTGARSTQRLGSWGLIASKLGLDPMRDVTRVLVTSPHAFSDSSAVVLEVHAPRDFLVGQLALAAGVAPQGTPPRALVEIEDGVTMAIAIGDVVIAVPARHGKELDAFAAPMRLPAPQGPEAAAFFAFDLASSLGSMPAWPPTIGAAQSTIRLLPDGSGEVHFEAHSATPISAAQDAAALSAEAKRLLTVDLGLFDMEILTPPSFLPDGRSVKMTTHLSAEELAWLLAFTGEP